MDTLTVQKIFSNELLYTVRDESMTGSTVPNKSKYKDLESLLTQEPKEIVFKPCLNFSPDTVNYWVVEEDTTNSVFYTPRSTLDNIPEGYILIPHISGGRKLVKASETVVTIVSKDEAFIGKRDYTILGTSTNCRTNVIIKYNMDSIFYLILNDIKVDKLYLEVLDKSDIRENSFLLDLIEFNSLITMVDSYYLKQYHPERGVL